ncbi:MAG TPA: rod shape-determining protein RodA [Steroidobacteraceae bacterium]|jgi:rod shape determining protein RodA|nr:rod shape-determining protein RodA [Steroidobacteraceae bacterium]
MGIYEPIETGSRSQRTFTAAGRILGALKLDGPLLVGLGLITLYGFVVLYSASGQSWNRVADAAVRAALGGTAMCVLAQVKPAFLRRLAPFLFIIGVVLLIVVDITGHIGKGAQRWLSLGFFRFQPSEIMKLAVPMTCAWWLHDRPLPPSFGSLVTLAIIIMVPTGLTILQPDLGTGGLILIGGLMVVIMAGLQFRVIFALAAAGATAAWLAWEYVLYEYQKQRVFMLFDPEADKLGAGYHIIQSQIAIGSGGVFGKGLLNGSQGQLEFLPERTTDFIFAMVGEELGFLGATILLLLYLFVVARALYLAVETQDTFARLLAGSIALTFFVYVFINAGMVSGLLPVVGVPLPLVSYGGTSMVTLLASFGILMSLYSHRKLVAS